MRNLAPLAPAGAARGLRPIVWTSRDSAGLWGGPAFSGEIRLVEPVRFQDLAGLLAELRPVACICGTTRFVSPDRLLVQAARAAGVRSVVVLDEWFNYRHRFEDPATGELVYLPDAVAVQDRQAREEAAAEGVPAHICHITGSPALAELTRRARLLAAAPPKPPEILGDGAQRPVMTFLSETHAADYGTGPDSPGRLGPFIGYTEITVRQAILEALRRLGERVILVEKLHPAAPDKRDTGLDIPANVDFRSTRKTDLWTLLWHSTAVIGMRSMALLEAGILGCEALSFQPGLIGPEQCTAVRLGLIPKMDQPGEMESWLAARLGPQAGRQRIIHVPDFAEDGAADRVINLALNQGEAP